MEWLTVLRILVRVLSTFTLVILFYQVVVALCSFLKRPSKRVVDEREHTFAIVISARNEQTVIGYLVDSLLAQEYPKDKFDVYVVADNSTDNTAAVARAHGAITYERDQLDKCGKGFALQFIFDIITRQGKSYDAYCIFDADNLVDKGYLAAMNRQLCRGVEVAQGYRDIKNPSDSWVSGCYAIYFWCLSRFFLRARDNIGLSCIASGTGFMFRSDLLGREGWITNTITEDSEFSFRQILAGKKVHFAEDAVFYDEQPTAFKQSVRQRYRWAVGNLQCLKLFTPKLLTRTDRKLGMARLDLLVYLLGIPCSGLALISSVLTLIVGWAGQAHWYIIVLSGVISGLVSILAMLAHGLLTVLLERKDPRKVWKGILGWPLFLFTWMWINLAAIFYRNPIWKPVHHTRSIGIESMEQECASSLGKENTGS
ncbi:MAG: glycosyltransferase family 2 protein [Christensenellales bacterium]|jgi:cellulose synthase/poly-beta-1,6-N-acetylglucosamine synthase-like glycosyltransferase